MNQHNRIACESPSRSTAFDVGIELTATNRLSELRRRYRRIAVAAWHPTSLRFYALILLAQIDAELAHRAMTAWEPAA